MTDHCCGAPGAPPPPLERRPAWWRADGWVRMALALACITAGVLTARSGLDAAAFVSYLASIALTVGTPLRRSLQAVRKGVLDINVLMVIAVAGALVIGEPLEAAAVVWLFAVAQWLESQSLDRARRAIHALMTIAPEVASVRQAGGVVDRPVDQVAVGETIVVRPGQRVPLDGTVVHGTSAVNQAPITGESWPVEKRDGDDVFAGTINGTGALDVRVDRPAGDSALARIVGLVAAAERQRAPVQAFVDRFARIYTPAVALLAVIVAVAPPLFGFGEAGVWAYRGIALLVVACPCALVISTPVSIVSGLTAAARAGVLIKGGAHLERLATVTCVAFDKTGTLTEGRLTVTDVEGVDGTTRTGVLAVAAALESRSEHPIGRAIVKHAAQAGVEVEPGAGYRALPGLGAEAMVASRPALVGSHRLFEERALCTPDLHARIAQIEDRGANLVVVGQGGVPLGVIGFTDEIRPGSREAVTGLRGVGVREVVLLTGDAAAHAEAVRAGVGLDAAHAGLLPDDKVRFVADLRRRHGAVAMVGDGVNDAPALAAADVGIAMGAAGSDVALETADVALMSDDLSRLPFAVALARATARNIRQNVALALGLKLAFVGLAIGGLATLWMAVLADTGASILVLANALRLLRLAPAAGD